MFKIPFDEKLEIGKGLSWSTLKYGLCSYFALAYVEKYSSFDSFLAVKEYDEELEKEYLVHFLIIGEEDSLIDAYGTYSDWFDSVNEITDIEFMDLSTEEVNKQYLLDSIEQDLGINQDIYDTIKNFVNNVY